MSLVLQRRIEITMSTTVYLGQPPNQRLFSWSHVLCRRVQSGAPICCMLNNNTNKLEAVVDQHTAWECQGGNTPVDVDFSAYSINHEDFPQMPLVFEFSNAAQNFYLFYIGNDLTELLNYTKRYTVGGTSKRVYDLIVDEDSDREVVVI